MLDWLGCVLETWFAWVFWFGLWVVELLDGRFVTLCKVRGCFWDKISDLLTAFFVCVV